MRRISLALERRFIHPVLIQRKTRIDTEMGGYTEEWATIHAVNGFFRPLSGTEVVEAAQRKLTSTHRFTAPYIEIDSKDRLVYNSKAYPITYVHDTMNAQRTIQVEVNFTEGEQVVLQEKQTVLIEGLEASLSEYTGEEPTFRLGVQAKLQAQAASMQVDGDTPDIYLVTQVYITVEEEAQLLSEAAHPLFEAGDPVEVIAPSAVVTMQGEELSLVLTRSAYIDALEATMNTIMGNITGSTSLGVALTPEEAVMTVEVLDSLIQAVKTAAIETPDNISTPVSNTFEPSVSTTRSTSIESQSPLMDITGDTITLSTAIGSLLEPESAVMNYEGEEPTLEIVMPTNATVDLTTLLLGQIANATSPQQNSDYTVPGYEAPVIVIEPKQVMYAATFIYDEDNGQQTDYLLNIGGSVSTNLASMLSNLNQTGSGAATSYVRVLSTQEAMYLDDNELNDTKIFVLHDSIMSPASSGAAMARFGSLASKIKMPIFCMNAQIGQKIFGAHIGLNTPTYQVPTVSSPQLNLLRPSSTERIVGNVLDFMTPTVAGGNLYRIGLYDENLSSASLPNSTNNRLYAHYSEYSTNTFTDVILRNQVPLNNTGVVVARHYETYGTETRSTYGISTPFMKLIYPSTSTGEKLVMHNLQKGIIKDLIERSPKKNYAFKERV